MVLEESLGVSLCERSDGASVEDGLAVDRLFVARDLIKGLATREERDELPVVREELLKGVEVIEMTGLTEQEKQFKMGVVVRVDQMDGRHIRGELVDEKGTDRELLSRLLYNGHHHSPFDV